MFKVKKAQWSTGSKRLSKALLKATFFVVLAFSSFLLPVGAEALQCKSLLGERHQDPSSLLVRTVKDLGSVMDRVSTEKDVSVFLDQLSEFIKELELKSKLKSDPDSEFNFRSGRLFEKKIIKHIKNFKPKNFVQALRIISKSTHRHLSEAFMLEFEKEALKKGPHFKSSELAHIIFFLGKLKNRPSLEFLRRWEDLMASKINKFGPVDLSMTMLSYGAFGLQPGRFLLKTWWGRLKTQLEGPRTFEGRQVANILYALYLTKLFDVMELYIESVPQKKWGSIQGESQLNQVSLVQQYLEKVKRNRVPELEIFRGFFKENVEKPSGGVSNLEEKAWKVLRRRGVQFIAEHQTRPGFYVDVYAQEGRKVYQIDGPGHFIVSYEGSVKTEHLRPQDGLMDEVLAVHSYEVERWTYQEVNKRFGNLEPEDHSSAEGFTGLYGNGFQQED